MKIVFSGLDQSIVLGASWATTLSIRNRALFARICQSLLSGRGDRACEPYTLWSDQGEEIRPEGGFFSVVNPFELPWKHKALVGQVQHRINELLIEDEETRRGLQELAEEIASRIGALTFQLHGSYEFGDEWGLVNYLKLFGFDACRLSNEPLLDNLMSFIDYVADARINKALLFINLQTFLKENELEQLIERLIFHGFETLFLENEREAELYENEVGYTIDQRFLEYKKVCQSASPSPLQGRICSNGFGAVTI